MKKLFNFMAHMSYEYKDLFYNYQETGSSRSAIKIIKIVKELIKPNSVLDVGCGRGAWCSQWIVNGIPDVIGIDGDYINREDLLIPSKLFVPNDVSVNLDLGRKFDLVVSLEVAEHIPIEKADTFVNNLVRHGPVILFSAATPGQGGEFHINEQPLEFWRSKFKDRNFEAFDILRPLIKQDKEIEPWYKNNTLLYVHNSFSSLNKDIIRTKIENGKKIPLFDSLSWKIRKYLLNLLPAVVVHYLSHLYHIYKTKRGSS